MRVDGIYSLLYGEETPSAQHGSRALVLLRQVGHPLESSDDPLACGALVLTNKVLGSEDHLLAQ